MRADDPVVGVVPLDFAAARAYAEYIPQMIWLADPEGYVRACNARLIAEIGCDPSTESELWASLIHPEDMPRVEERYREAIENKTPYDVEMRLRVPSGHRWRWYRSAALPVKDESGAVRWWSGTLSLTDARHRLQSALRATADALTAGERRFQIALDTIPALVYEMDMHDGRMVGLFGCEKLLGSSPSALGNQQAFLERIHPDDVDAILAESRAATAERRTFEVEYRIRHGAGHYIWVHQHARTLYTDEGVAQRRVGVQYDVTARRHAEDQLREADRRKDEFLGILAHELRNPLAVLRAGVDLLARRPDMPPARRTIDILDAQLRTLTRLVGDLLDITRIGRGIFRLDRRPLDLVELVEQVRQVMDRRVRDRGQTLTVTCPDAPIPLLADPERLQQIFVNLLVNASSYTEQGGHIDLTVRRDGDHVEIEVRDDGEGIDAELLPQVFELFTQGDRSLARSTVGLGIGLHLVRRLVEGHDGEITAESAGKGQGSTFRVRLPIAEDVAPVAITPPPVVPSLAILVVDDNREYLEHQGPVLAEAGHRVRVAYDGPSALEAIDGFTPDLVLLDIGLPGMDGFELATRLREKLGRDVVLVAVSGYDQPGHRSASARAGVDFHLGKPLDLDVLNRLIAQKRVG